MADLKSFKEELEKEGINTKFTRLPGGLISQLQAYAKHFGLRKNGGRAAAKAVLNGHSFDSLGLNGSPAELQALKTGFNKIVSDFATMKASLKDMGILLWGNPKDDKGRSISEGSEISRLSWNAECSGTLALNDTVTYAVSLESRRGSNYARKYAGLFEKDIAKIMKDGETRSLLVLSHDTKMAYYKEILRDRDVMEAHAQKKRIKIEYVTMSTLFNRVTGKNALTFKPDY